MSSQAKRIWPSRVIWSTVVSSQSTPAGRAASTDSDFSLGTKTLMSMSRVPRGSRVQYASATAPPNAYGISAPSSRRRSSTTFSTIGTESGSLIREDEGRSAAFRVSPARPPRAGGPERGSALALPARTVEGTRTERVAGAVTSRRPAAASTRSRVPAVGAFVPRSYEEIVACDVPLRSASSACVRPAAASCRVDHSC